MEFEIPKSQPKITKEFLLSRNSEETYMSTYLGTTVKRGLQISALRKDHKPTASFYRNKKGDLIYHDFGLGFHGNFIDVVMYLYHCDYVTAIHRIAEDFHYIDKVTERPIIKIRKTETKIEEKLDTQIQIEVQPFQNYELQWWESFGIHEATLKKFKVFSCKSVFLNGNYYKSSTPRSNIFGYYGGKKDGLELWRIYFPQMREFRFLSNWSKSMIQGARQLPKEMNTLVITKSMKDVLNLYESNIPACAPNGETVLIPEQQMDRLQQRCKQMFYLGDNDLPGVRAAHRYKKAYPFLHCIFINRKYAKDISDLYKHCGEKEYREAIEELKMVFNSEEKIYKTKHFWIF